MDPNAQAHQQQAIIHNISELNSTWMTTRSSYAYTRNTTIRDVIIVIFLNIMYDLWSGHNAFRVTRPWLNWFLQLFHYHWLFNFFATKCFMCTCRQNAWFRMQLNVLTWERPRGMIPGDVVMYIHMCMTNILAPSIITPTVRYAGSMIATISHPCKHRQHDDDDSRQKQSQQSHMTLRDSCYTV